ncbi:MAG: hypothetical protein PHP93_08650 [Kiritimatiellales bacterium]|nr:hypothetical protein [Kiritimatiellales bacterium]
MTRRIVILFSLVLLAGSARAILPPDAKAREPQLRVYRQQLNMNYEKHLVERQELSVRAYEQTRKDIFIPPWMRETAQTAQQSDVSSTASAQGKTAKRNHRFLVSVVLLILLGAVAGWIRHATREIDE